MNAASGQTPYSGPAPHWEHFHHGADIGVRGVAPTKERAFEQAALALTGVITDPDRVRSNVTVDITCDSADPELLLVDWLNAVIFEMACRHVVFGYYEVRIDGDKLQGTAWGEAVDSRRHQPAVEVKGATYTELSVGNDGKGTWWSQCVVDV